MTTANLLMKYIPFGSRPSYNCVFVFETQQQLFYNTKSFMHIVIFPLQVSIKQQIIKTIAQ